MARKYSSKIISGIKRLASDGRERTVGDFVTALAHDGIDEREVRATLHHMQKIGHLRKTYHRDIDKNIYTKGDARAQIAKAPPADTCPIARMYKMAAQERARTKSRDGTGYGKKLLDRADVIEAIKSGMTTSREIAEALEFRVKIVSMALNGLKRQGRVKSYKQKCQDAKTCHIWQVTGAGHE